MRQVSTNNENLVYGVFCEANGENASGVNYTIQAHQGSSVNEIAFCVALTIRALTDDKHIADHKSFISLVEKYLTDPQYAPIAKEEVETDERSKADN